MSNSTGIAFDDRLKARLTCHSLNDKIRGEARVNNENYKKNKKKTIKKKTNDRFSPSFLFLVREHKPIFYFILSTLRRPS